MIDPTKFERVRIVQDLGIDALEALPKEEDGTKVLANVFDATDDSLFPLQGALGYEIQQTLFIGPNSLIVEGVADMLYLRAMSAQMEREGREGMSKGDIQLHRGSPFFKSPSMGSITVFTSSGVSGPTNL